MNYEIAVIPGDGLGPEIVKEAIKVLKAVGNKFERNFKFQIYAAGGAAIDEFGVPLPESTLEGCKQCGAILFGSVGGPKWDNEPWDNIHTAITPSRGIQVLRGEFQLYANLRPAKSYAHLFDTSPIKKEVLADTDVLVIREQCGGLYFGEPRGIVREKDVRRGFNTLSYTEAEIARVAHLAFKLARSRKKRLTSVDKHNVIESSVLWREVVNRISNEYPDITLNHMYADNAALQLVLNPRQYDVIVTGNIFGDILSDLTACYHGSLGVMPSASVGDGKFGLYEPIHGSAPDIAGKNIANPISAILSAKMMLEYSFDLSDDASVIDRAVDTVLAAGYRTADIYNPGTQKITTEKMGDLIVEEILK